MKKINWKEDVNIFGYLKSRRELFWNGIMVLLFNIAYNVFTFVSLTPIGWQDMTTEEIQNLQMDKGTSNTYMLVIMITFFLAYWLLNKALLPPVKEMVEKGEGAKSFIINMALAVAIIGIATIIEFGLYFIIISLR